MSILPSILALGLAIIAAFLMARRRPSLPEQNAERQTAARALTLAALAQCIHFGEETSTGFHIEFPELFGLQAMPLSIFVSFNLVWISIWFASIRGLRSGKKWAFFASWFLAIAGMLNLVAHPVMSLITAGYFPGLFTSPLIGAMSIWLWIRLIQATRDPGLITNE